MAEKLLKRISLVLLVFAIVVLSCSLPVGGANNNNANNVDIQGTQVALSIKATQLANMEATQLAENQQAQVKPTSTNPPPAAAPTYTPYPTYTVPPAANTVQASPQPTPAAGQDIQAKIKAANILVYEDIRGYPALLPRVQQAISTMDFSGGQIVEVGDAVGDFMTQLELAD